MPEYAWRITLMRVLRKILGNSGLVKLVGLLLTLGKNSIEACAKIIRSGTPGARS